MSEQQQILSIIDNLGGRENIKDYYHCATRLRFNLFDYDKINKDALKANPLVLSVVQASGQCQLIIGNKVGAVYSALHGVLETGGQNSAPSSSGTAANRESFISRIFAFISGSFLPLIGILAAAGLLRAFTTLLLSLPSLAGNSTLTLLSFIANVPFYFMPVLLGFTIARKLKSSELTGAIIGASLLYPEFTSLAGQTLNIIGLPLVVMEYGYSIFPVFFAVPVAVALERFLKVRLWDSVQLFMVPLLCVVIVVPLTMFLLGPFGKYLGDYLASAIVYIIGVNSLVAGMIIGAAYSFIVLFGLHWAIIPVVFSNIAHGGDPIMITENGIGCFDELVNETVEDDYRIAFFRDHIRSVGEAIADGVEVLGYYMWSPLDIISCSSNQMSKRYGLVYVNLDDLGRGDGRRFCKKSYYWYQKLIATNGKSLEE
ncbi:TPA: family 1 glycosylhydrolase [Klebsiella pneumoniae]